MKSEQKPAKGELDYDKIAHALDSMRGSPVLDMRQGEDLWAWSSKLLARCRDLEQELETWVLAHPGNAEGPARIAELEKDRERLEWLERDVGLLGGTLFLQYQQGGQLFILELQEGLTLRQALDDAKELPEVEP